MARPRRDRRSLSNVGGHAIEQGDPGASHALAHCLDVGPVESLPYTHGFHAYPARMHPETARRALAAFAGPGGVLDPFVGSGTVAVEALRLGRSFTGVDISRVALEIAWIRTRIWVPEKCREVEQAALRIARRCKSESSKPRELPAWTRTERDWYPPHTLHEIALLRSLIEEESGGDLRRVLVGVLSSIVVKLSLQTSDSLTIPDKFFRSRPPGAASRMFAEKAEELTGGLLRLSSDLHKRKIQAPEPIFRREDSRGAAYAPGSADLVLTSPPYPGTYDYVLHHERRFPLYGEEGALERRAEIGARREFKAREHGFERYREDIGLALGAAAKALGPGGRMVVLVGDGLAPGGQADSLAVMHAVTGRLGLAFRASASQVRHDWAYDRKSPRRKEHLVLLARPR